MNTHSCVKPCKMKDQGSSTPVPRPSAGPQCLAHWVSLALGPRPEAEILEALNPGLAQLHRHNPAAGLRLRSLPYLWGKLCRCSLTAALQGEPGCVCSACLTASCADPHAQFHHILPGHGKFFPHRTRPWSSER